MALLTSRLPVPPDCGKIVIHFQFFDSSRVSVLEAFDPLLMDDDYSDTDDKGKSAKNQLQL